MIIGLYIFAFAAAAAVFSGALIFNYYHYIRIESPSLITPEGTDHVVGTDSPPSAPSGETSSKLDVTDTPKREISSDNASTTSATPRTNVRTTSLPVPPTSAPSAPSTDKTIPSNEGSKTRPTARTIILIKPLPPAPKDPTGVCGIRVLKRGLNKAQMKELLNSHNVLRKKVADGLEKRGKPGPQPGALDLKDLVWSSELASVAQGWANKCNYSHDKNRNMGHLKVGQNIAIENVYNKKFMSLTEMIIDKWYDEVEDVDKAMVPSYHDVPGPLIGHYTQMVWAKTTHVGCGSIIFLHDSGWESRYLVCNYSPAGNTIAQPIYLTKK